MKKTLLLFLCMIMLVGTVLSLSACKKCDEHIDANHDLICDVCEEATEPSNLLPKDYAPSYEQPVAESYDKTQQIKGIDNMYLSSGNDYFFIFHNGSAEDNEPQDIVINAETGEKVLTVKYQEPEEDKKYTSTSVSLNEDLIIKRDTNKDKDGELINYTHSIYDVNGELIASETTKSSSSSLEFRNDTMFIFDGKLYKYVDGVATEMFEIGLSSIPSFDYASDKYYYDISNAGNYNGTFSIYDSEFKLVQYYQLPNNNVYNSYINLLSNGNVLIQYTSVLPFDAAEYDILISGNKFDFTSILFNVETKEYSELSLDFMVTNIENKLVSPDNKKINYDKIPNVAFVSKIENKAVSTDKACVYLSDDGRILGYLDNLIPNQKDGYAHIIDEDRYLVWDKSGKSYVVKGDGTMIGEASASFNYDIGRFVKDGKYYDSDTNEVFDANDEGYTLVGYSSFLYTDGENNYYVIKNDDFEDVSIDAVGGNFSFDESGKFFSYTYTSGGTRYIVYYNNQGDKISNELNLSKAYDYGVYKYGDSIIIYYQYYNNSKYVTEYYFSALQ